MEVRAISTPPSNSLPPVYRRIETLPPLDAVFVIVTSLVVISAIAASIYAHLPKTIQRSFSFKWHSKVPCHRCHYFNDNPYIRCALHPRAVVTKQAVDCQDYRPNRVAKGVKK
jgi:hypothetical protein